MNLAYYFRKLIYKVIPTKNERVLFTSFDGHYSDNPRSISELLHNLDPTIEISWMLEKRYFDQAPDYIKKVEKGSALADYYFSTAGYLVDNSFGNNFCMLNNLGIKARIKFEIIKFFKFKRNQHTFSTWHGTPLKKMGRDQIGFNVYKFESPSTEMLLGNKYTLDIMQNISFNKIEMKLMGSPRNDILFEQDRSKIDAIKSKIGLPLDKKIILFAPTFRSDSTDGMNKNILRSGINQLNEFDINELLSNLKQKFGSDWVLVCRLHYYVEEMIDWKNLKDEYGDKVINGNKFDEMSEYLLCTDLLVTDASSSMFDFAITKRPCLLYFPDLEFYEEKERGFYVSLNELPYSVATNFSEFQSNIFNFDQVEFSKGVDNMMNKFGYVDNEFSSSTIANYIAATIHKK